jgi:hypothetical protein
MTALTGVWVIVLVVIGLMVVYNLTRLGGGE